MFKKIVLALALLVPMSAAPASAEYNRLCGFKPFQPLGCYDGYAVCQCDSSGKNCQWVWVNC